MLEEIGKLISPLLSGFALMWAIYSFVLKRRDAKAAQDRTSFLLTSQAERDAVRTSIASLETKIAMQAKELESLRISIVQATERMDANKEMQRAQFDRIERSLTRYEDKLDSFGKVIVK